MLAHGVVEIEGKYVRAIVRAELVAGRGRMLYSGAMSAAMVGPTIAAINSLTYLESFERVASPEKLARSDLKLSCDIQLPIDGDSLSLALCMAILGCLTRKEVPKDMCFTGGVGPAGEVIGVADVLRKRLCAAGLGYKKFVHPWHQLDWTCNSISQVPVKDLIEAYSVTFCN